MFRFILGVIMGAVAASYLRLPEMAQRMPLGETVSDLQRRAQAGLTESRHILDETGDELKVAATAGMQSVGNKALRLRRAIEHPESVTGQPGSGA